MQMGPLARQAVWLQRTGTIPTEPVKNASLGAAPPPTLVTCVILPRIASCSDARGRAPVPAGAIRCLRASERAVAALHFGRAPLAPLHRERSDQAAQLREAVVARVKGRNVVDDVPANSGQDGPAAVFLGGMIAPSQPRVGPAKVAFRHRRARSAYRLRSRGSFRRRRLRRVLTSAGATTSVSLARTSVKVNRSKVLTYETCVLRGPMPNTFRPDSRIRRTSGVKSLSPETTTEHIDAG